MLRQPRTSGSGHACLLMFPRIIGNTIYTPLLIQQRGVFFCIVPFGGEVGTEKAGRMLSLPLSYRLMDKNIRIFRIMIIIRILIIITPFIKLKGENLLPIDFCGQTGYS